jgi:hypothetical protein
MRDDRSWADSASSLAPTERLLSRRNGRRIRRAQDREGSGRTRPPFLAFVRFAPGYAPLLLKLGVCCKSLI